MSKTIKTIARGAVSLPLACSSPSPAPSITENVSGWKEALQEVLPLLGHRNWIVVTDMAYPLQTGIKTLFADEDYMSVIEYVYEAVESKPHIKPLIYQDQELSFMDDTDSKGVEAIQKQMQELLGDKIIVLPHEAIIGKLDAVSKMFSVVIIKTPLTIPYTSTFFELDCGYWASEKEAVLQQKIAAGTKK
jgi:D-ribose pyranose/furanose isomerase RbsD